MADIVTVMLDDHFHALGDVVGMQAHPLGQSPRGLLGIDLLLLAIRMRELPGGAIGDVVAQHVEDKALLDGLTHGVEVERLGLVVGTGGQVGIRRTAEQLQGLGLGGGSEGVVADALAGAP